MPKAEHMSGSLGAMQLLTCLQYSTWLKQSADSDLSPLSFHQKPVSVTQNNCKLNTEDDCMNKYNKLILMEWNPSLAYLFVMLLYTNIPQVRYWEITGDAPHQSTTVWHHRVCHLASKHPPTPTEGRCLAQFRGLSAHGAVPHFHDSLSPTPSVNPQTAHQELHCMSRLLPGSAPETMRNTFTDLPNPSHNCFSGGKTFLTWLQPGTEHPSLTGSTSWTGPT